MLEVSQTFRGLTRIGKWRDFFWRNEMMVVVIDSERRGDLYIARDRDREAMNGVDFTLS